MSFYCSILKGTSSIAFSSILNQIGMALRIFSFELTAYIYNKEHKTNHILDSNCFWNYNEVIFHLKELALCDKHCFSNPNIFGFQRRKPMKFQTMTFVRLKTISLKYQRFTTLVSKEIGIRKSEFVAKSQFLCIFLYNLAISGHSVHSSFREATTGFARRF